jgi:hypothetical protein
MKDPLFLDSIAAVGMHVITLAEAQVLKSVVELRLQVDQPSGGARRAAGEKSCAKNYRKNNGLNFHGTFLSRDQ